MLVDVRFESLTGQPYRSTCCTTRRLANAGDDDRGRDRGGALRRLATPARQRARRLARPHARPPAATAAPATAGPTCAPTTGWTALRRADAAATSSRPARPALDRPRRPPAADARPRLRRRRRRGRAATAARVAAPRLRRRAARLRRAAGTRYLDGAARPPRERRAAAAPQYDVSVMVLAAPRGQDLPRRVRRLAVDAVGVGQRRCEQPVRRLPPGLVARPLPDRHRAARRRRPAGAEPRARLPVRRASRSPTARSRRTRASTATPYWTSLQLDEVALPIVLAWQLGRTDAATWRARASRAADFIVANGPQTPQERWENQDGYSPATIAAEIAGLVCAADIAAPQRRRRAAPTRYLRDRRRLAARSVEGWTVDHATARYSPEPYYLRLTKDGQPERRHDATRSATAARRRRPARGRRPELPRARAARRQAAPTTRRPSTRCRSSTASSACDTPNGQFWHRYNFDGYGETRDGGPWDIGFPARRTTVGRAVAAVRRRARRVRARRRRSARRRAPRGRWPRRPTTGWLLPEQVWDDQPPAGRPGSAPGEGTLSATPLAWTHAQFVRLALVDRRRPPGRAPARRRLPLRARVPVIQLR